ncbi:MAG TPA: hypothetical protein VHK26_01760 [Methyloceanibacter sp.]|jgi:hypothetical protein|nr:hypothetical protein [Methyloceanibacter sp.]
MRTVTILGLGAFCLLFALPAEALTISNTDADPHTITVKTGSDSTEVTIAPAAAVEPPCQSGCTIELENGELYELSGGEEASIESGALFVDAAPDIENDEMTGATPAPAGDAAKAQ